jgi:hypothetical protein
MSRLPKILRRIITIGISAVIVFLLIVGAVAYFINAKNPPSVQEAPWLIQTSSRIYYASEFSVQNGIQAIRGFWYSNGGRWIFNSGIMTFPQDIFGPISIIRRTQ